MVMMEPKNFNYVSGSISYTDTNHNSFRYFSITSKNRSYGLAVPDPSVTLDSAWASEKRFFMPGSVVIITDDRGNSKTFVKE